MYAQQAATSQHAVYRFPAKRPDVLNWLDACIQDVVRNVAEAPFLALVSSPSGGRVRLERHTVSRRAVEEALEAIRSAGSGSGAGPELAVLVKKLSGISQATDPAVAADVNLDVVSTGIASQALGTRPGPAGDGQGKLARRLSSNLQHIGRTVEYWGLRVQSRLRSSAEGCYVLKTVTNRSPVSGYQSTYYTLMKSDSCRIL